MKRWQFWSLNLFVVSSIWFFGATISSRVSTAQAQDKQMQAYLELMPFPYLFRATVNGKEKQLVILSADRAGVAFYDSERTKVYKIPYRMPVGRPATIEEKDLLKSSKDLFLAEKNLLIDLPKEAEGKEELNRLSQFIVPTRIATLVYEGQIFSVLEKDYYLGKPLSQFHRDFPEESFPLLEELYKQLKLVAKANRYIFDIHSGNVYLSRDEKKQARVWIVGGGFDHREEPSALALFLNYNCPEWNWCDYFFESDPEFSIFGKDPW